MACAQILPEIEAAVSGLLQYPPRVMVTDLGDAPVLAGAVAHAADLAWQQVVTRRITQAASTRAQQPL